MNQTKYENVLFFVTLANIVLGVTSVTLGTLALVAIRTCNRVERALTAKQQEISKELVPWHQRPQSTLEFRRPPRISPSLLAQTRRDFKDDLWG